MARARAQGIIPQCFSQMHNLTDKRALSTGLKRRAQSFWDTEQELFRLLKVPLTN